MSEILFEKPARPVDRVFLHCSASEAAAAAGALLALVRKWHVEERGWADVGYHFLVDRAGAVIPARPLSATPAAQRGHNTGTIAICAHGLNSFPSPQLAAVAALCRAINQAYLGRISFHGHCEVSAKSCPVFDYHGLLKLDRWQRMP